MKTILAVCLLLAAAACFGQGSPTIGMLPDSGITIPTSCSAPQIFFQTGSGGSGAGLYVCISGTFTKLGTGAGTVTTVSGTANQIGSTGGATPVLSLSSTLAFPGTISSAQAGALSQAAVTFTGAPITGGSGTTTFPLVYLNGGAAPTTWDTGGTILGLNSPNGFAGTVFDYHNNGGVSLFSINGANGAITTNSSAFIGGDARVGLNGNFFFNARSRIGSPADGVLQLTNNAATGLTRIQLGLTTSSGPALCISGVVITTCLGDGTAPGFTGLGTTVVASLPAAAAGNKGQMIAVSDSTAVAAEGQTCAGSSTNTALAFSNGTVWKCF